MVLLGDAIHTVKPFFGLGVNSAFEDIVVLSKCLDEGKGDMSRACSQFSRVRGPEAVALVELSRGWDMKGFRGAMKFVIPIILDATFGKIFPFLFRPNTLSWIQNPDRSFTQVRRRKRWDNTVQVSMLMTALFTALFAVKTLLVFLFQMALRLVA
mmetsp:Transcript_3062/g.7356  ORF Transcript_3062/g.7356 Transcript_3062/m.7356 type:complete len:155 (+) Transcript_3062:954-1418(+)